MVNEEFLLKYATLVLKKGVNLREGQSLFVNAPIEGADFARKLTERAYELGAKNVHINWNDDEITRLTYAHAAEDVLEVYPEWRREMQEAFADEGAAFVSIHATDPDLLVDVDPGRIAKASKAAGMALRNFRAKLMNDEMPWTVISIPTEAWAEKIFPDLDPAQAVQALWQEIAKMVRLDKDNPIAAWDTHNATLEKAHRFLNEKQYEKLVFKAPGTELEVGLPENHLWQGGTAKTTDGVVFNPNMPTEEVYTAPHATKVNGTVTNTKPLNHGGSIIDGFTLTFKDGKVVDYSAEKGEEVLAHLLDTDEGARRLGEVALVPHESPVSRSGLIFYNTLFDENASCHVAFGKAYPTSIEGGTEMDEKQLEKNGINDSVVHVDFMIGSEEMDIDGVTKDGKVEPLFRNGTWAVTF